MSPPALHAPCLPPPLPMRLWSLPSLAEKGLIVITTRPSFTFSPGVTAKMMDSGEPLWKKAII